MVQYYQGQLSILNTFLMQQDIHNNYLWGGGTGSAVLPACLGSREKRQAGCPRSQARLLNSNTLDSPSSLASDALALYLA